MGIHNHDMRGESYMVFVIPSGSPIERCVAQAASLECQLDLALAAEAQEPTSWPPPVLLRSYTVLGASGSPIVPENPPTASSYAEVLEQLAATTLDVLASGPQPVPRTGLARLLQMMSGSYRPFLPG